MKNPGIFLIVLLALTGCFKEKYENPYDGIEDPSNDPPTADTLDPKSLPGLHANIFRPTCANSGCHDGTFEPDFRTVQSTYHTLVDHPIIKNDPQGSFSVRVKPGDVAASLLIARLTYDIDGNSGTMPLILEPDSDWPEKKEQYIQDVRDWIAAGAEDGF